MVDGSNIKHNSMWNNWFYDIDNSKIMALNCKSLRNYFLQTFTYKRILVQFYPSETLYRYTLNFSYPWYLITRLNTLR